MRARSNSENADGAEAPRRESAGTLLRDARVATGQSLEHVAAALRIRLVYLRAIEDGRYEELPGAAYAGGFLRSFSEHLGLDPERIVHLYKDEMRGRESKQELYFPTPASEGRVPGGTLLFATLLLAGAVYGGWYYLSATDRSMVDVVPALPDRLVALVQGLPWRSGGDSAAPGDADATPSGDGAVSTGGSGRMVDVTPPNEEPSASPASSTRDGAAGDGAATPSAPPPAVSTPPAPAAVPAVAPSSSRPVVEAPPASRSPSPPVAPAPSAVNPQAANPQAANPPASGPAASAAVERPGDQDEEGEVQPPTPLTDDAGSLASAETPELTAPAPELPAPTRVFGEQNAASRIQLRATQDSWIQVKDGGGDLLFTRVLKPGEVYRVPDRPGIRVRTGNAGGLIVVTDGVAGPPMGAVGQVLRDVPLDAPSLRPASG